MVILYFTKGRIIHGLVYFYHIKDFWFSANVNNCLVKALLRQQEWCENLRAMHWLMCKYFDFFLFAIVNFTNFTWGEIDIWKNSAQAGEEVWGRRQHRTTHPPTPQLVLTEILNLWEVRWKLFANAPIINAPMRVPKPLAGVPAVAGARRESVCVQAGFVWRGHGRLLGEVGVERGYRSCARLQLPELGLSLSCHKSMGEESRNVYCVMSMFNNVINMPNCERLQAGLGTHFPILHLPPCLF